MHKDQEKGYYVSMLKLEQKSTSKTAVEYLRQHCEYQNCHQNHAQHD